MLGVTTRRYLSEMHYRERLNKFRKYNPDHWWGTLKVHASGFMVKPWAALVIFTLALTKFAKDYMPEFLPEVSLNPSVHAVLGSALSFIMVFRTNTAYSRWGEARLLWGQVSNNVRSVASRARPMMKSQADFETLLCQMIVFAVLLKNHLRGELTSADELGELLPAATISRFSTFQNPPLAAISACSTTVRGGLKMDGADAVVANASYQTLMTALDNMAQAVGGMERIKNTPTPFGYVAALRTFILIWLSTMPFTLIGPFGWLASVAIGMLSFLFLNLEQMAMEIEQPFGDDADDLPLEEYCLGIEKVCLDAIKK